MPPLTAPHIVEHLMDAGLVQSTGMGLAPLSWTSLRDWREETGVSLQAWEKRLIIRLSSEYISALQTAENPSAPEPWTDGPAQVRHALVDDALDALGVDQEENLQGC